MLYRSSEGSAGMKRSFSLLMACGLCLIVSVPPLPAQSSKAPPPPPPQVWGPHLPGKEPVETNECVKQCNAEFEKELKKCMAFEGGARPDCEQPVRARHRGCFTGCPK